MDQDFDPIELIAAVYSSPAAAQSMLNELVRLHQQDVIELIDAAVMERDGDGKLHISERAELTPAKGAKRGALIGAALGIIFPPSLLATTAIGAAAGALTGKATDQGLDNKMLADLGSELRPGTSAIIAVVDHKWYSTMVNALSGYDRILANTLHADEIASFEL